MTDTNYASLVSTDTHSNAIDVYLLSPNDTYSRAVDIPGIALAVGGSYAGTSVLSHEFGHCLGLFHTHSGRGCNDYANCAENIDESNCTTCGDLVCDTPADPCLSGNVNTNCEYIGDPSFSPDVRNIMSYAPPVCLNDLTNGQTIRIHSTISSNSIFINRSYKPIISGPSLVCPSGATFSINNLPPVDSIVWTCGPYLSVSSGQNTASCTFSTSGSGNSWVRARLVTDCGNITLPAETVWVGAPPQPVVSGSSPVTCDNSLFTEASHRSVTWSVYGPLQIIGSNYGYRCTVQGTGSGTGWVYATATNDCGTLRGEMLVEVDCGYLLSVTPNPSASETTLELIAKDKKTLSETAEWDLEIYDAMQNLKAKVPEIKGSRYTFNTSGWKDGIYIVRANYNGELLTEKLVVKKL
jgi:hypothetical protein